MIQGDELTAVIGASMALTLAFRALSARRMPTATLLWMALAWAVVIAGVALIASHWAT